MRTYDYTRHTEHLISGFNEDYRWLSNFWPCGITYRNLSFGSVESAYQAAKCSDYEEMKSFAGMTPFAAKSAGRGVSLRPDWEDGLKLAIMNYLVFQKFDQNIDLQNKLLATRGKILIEANDWKDNFWGIHFEKRPEVGWIGSSGGKNMLGKILMDVRNALS